MIGYKLTTQSMQTFNNMQWHIGVKQTAQGDSSELCTDGVLHYYESPLLAVLMNPAHASIQNPRMFRVECSKRVATDGLKSGCKSQTLLEEIPLPEVTLIQRVAFGILCALEMHKDDSFVVWAHDWLSNKDRSPNTAEAARTAWLAAQSAAWWSAAQTAAWLAAWLAAQSAAGSAARTAARATNAGIKIDFKAIAQKAMEIE